MIKFQSLSIQPDKGYYGCLNRVPGLLRTLSAVYCTSIVGKFDHTPLMTIRTSLFEPAGSSSLIAAADWISGTLLGGVAATLCVLAVAFVGFMLLIGRFAVLQSMRVVLGCFIVVGAPVIAAALMGFGEVNSPVSTPPSAIAEQVPQPRADLPPADYDPYAGASLRND